MHFYYGCFSKDFLFALSKNIDLLVGKKMEKKLFVELYLRKCIKFPSDKEIQQRTQGRKDEIKRKKIRGTPKS